jgi:hypothetical protein
MMQWCIYTSSSPSTVSRRLNASGSHLACVSFYKKAILYMQLWIKYANLCSTVNGKKPITFPVYNNAYPKWIVKLETTALLIECAVLTQIFETFAELKELFRNKIIWFTSSWAVSGNGVFNEDICSTTVRCICASNRSNSSFNWSNRCMRSRHCNRDAL